MNVELFNDRYHIHAVVGEGGMGIIYSATDIQTNHRIALKKVKLSPGHFSLDTESKLESLHQSIEQEYQTLSELRHPNIVRVFDLGYLQDETPYFTMELLEDAKPINGASRKLSVHQKIDLIYQVLKTVGYIHQKGLIHRDVKPDNILVTPELEVSLVDFGLASPSNLITEAVGTLAYMSPEVLQEEQPTTASDIFSIGMILYEMLVGHHPYQGLTIKEFAAAILVQEPDYNKIPDIGEYRDGLIEILHGMLTKNPKARYQDTKEVIKDLDALFQTD